MVLAGVKLMIIGMGLVYLFLILLYLSVLVLGVAFRSEREQAIGASPSSAGGASDAVLTAVISAAIKRYRS